MSDLTALAVAVALLGLNAFFVGAEFALISVRRSAIEPLAAGGSRSARITLGAMERVSLMLAGAQLGITVCSLGLGAIGEPALAHLIEPPFEALGVPEELLHPVAFVLALAVVVFLHVVVGEMVPKNIALAAPERTALVLGPALVGVIRVLRPFIALSNAAANAVLRSLRVEPRDEVASAFTRDEVAGLVAESRREGLLDEDEHQLLRGALSFDQRTVAAVLLPVERLVTVAADATPAQVEALTARTGYSRFPVTRAGSPVGYLHLKDVLVEDPAARRRPVPPRAVRPLARVSLQDPLRAALTTMQRRRAHLALVLDGGRVVGVAALEDVLEELVGEVRDATQRSR